MITTFRHDALCAVFSVMKTESGTEQPFSALGSQYHVERSIRAVLIVDMVESVRLIERDEEGVVLRWLGLSRHVQNSVVQEFGGRLVKSLGDGMLLEFGDVRSAALAAFAIQAESTRRNAGYEADRQLFLRIGIEVSEIIVGPHDVYGRGVNLAARLASLGGPGDIVVSALVHDQLTPLLDADIEDLGECYLKHIETPVRAYRISPPGSHLPVRLSVPYLQLCPSIAIIPFYCRSHLTHQVLGEVLADELINAVSRSKEIDVISRLSTTAFRDRAVSLQTITEHLGANYVLSGTYAVSNEQISLQLELTDARSQRIVWSERMTDSVPDLLHGNQELIGRVATQIYTAVVSQELQRTLSRPLPTLESYTLLMSAIALMHRRSARDFLTSREMLQAVIDRSPRQSTPQAWLAKWYVLRIQQGMTNNAEQDAVDAMRCTIKSANRSRELPCAGNRRASSHAYDEASRRGREPVQKGRRMQSQ